MESFYQNWLEKNRRENEEVRRTLNRLNINQNPPIPSVSQQPSNVQTQSSTSPIPSTSQQPPNVQTQSSTSTIQQPPNVQTQSRSSPMPSTSQQSPNVQSSTNQVQNVRSDLRNQIIYQNDKLQLYLEKGDHVHQIRFRLQDHLFYMKIRLLNPKEEPPLLRDIVEFLELAFNHVLKEIRRSYKQVSISST